MNLNNYNPALKLILTILVSISFMFSFSFKLNIILVLISFLWLIISRVSIKKLLKINIFLLFFASIFYLSVISFAKQNGDYSTIASYNAKVIATKTLVFAYLGMLFSLTTKNLDLLYSLKNQLKVPDVFVYGIFAAFNLFSDIKNQVNKNLVSFNIRGDKVSRYSYRTIVPLLIKTIYYSDSIALAMESKGFKNNLTRSVYYETKLQKKDIMFVVICFLYIGLIIFI